MERDKSQIVALEVTIKFNSHAHVERDDHAYADFHHCKHFNSHAHVERDLGQQTSVADTKISTHTLTWSVTQNLLAHVNNIFISTHTLTWSVTYSLHRFSTLLH